MDRVFLDANVWYSAAYLKNSGLATLATLANAQLLTSAYAIEEARRNLAHDRPEALSRLKQLVAVAEIVNAPHDDRLPPNIHLASKDEPILLAPIYGHADYLLTGDRRHFAQLYGKRVEGVLILQPAEFFRLRRVRED